MEHGKHYGCWVAGLGRRVLVIVEIGYLSRICRHVWGLIVLSRECKIIWNMKWKQTDHEMEAREKLASC